MARNHSVINKGTAEQPNFAIVRNVSDRKRPVVKDGFATREEAMRHMAQNAHAVIEHKTRIDDSIHPALEEIERVGKDYRGGKPATDKSFREFGFRGVEFGKWNNTAERQHILNHAYDSMRGLADILGVEPADLSLNGEIGLGFGSRGHGLSGARAHYEPDYAAINLTKISGAGSLAHEWLHALDHYLGRQSGKASSEKVANSRGDMVFKDAADFAGSVVSHGHKSLRQGGDAAHYKPEIRDAFNNVMDAINHRTMKYKEDKSLHEKRMERAGADLESKIADMRRQFTHDYRQDQYKRGHAKYHAPASPEQMKEVDALLDKIRRGDVGEPVSAPSASKHGSSLKMPPELLRLNEIHKELRGRNAYYKKTSGYASTHHGHLIDLGHALGWKKSADAFLADAAEQKEKEKKVKTEFFSHAKRMDEGTKGDYWSENHELAARAFEAYIYDKLKQGGEGHRDDFLAFEKHNNLPEYRLFGVKPYPEGEERQAMNAAFDKLFQAIKQHAPGFRFPKTSEGSR